MTTIKIKKGLNLPITGEPEQVISDQIKVEKVALLGSDYNGMKPTMLVKEGDKVKKGQTLFTDKKLPEVSYTSPAAGEVIEINRGAKRVFQSVVIRVEGNEEESFREYTADKLAGLNREQVQKQLLKAGLWPCLRTRPYTKIADPAQDPHSIFVTAMDTNPLAPSAQLVINDNKEAFTNGVTVISRLTAGKTHLCKAAGADLPKIELDSVQTTQFAGIHPAGNVGTHIHFLDPVYTKKTVWHINYQDIIAVGKLFTTGKLYTDKVISLAGPLTKKPRLLRTTIGACIDDLIKDELTSETPRIISGSVFSGRKAEGSINYLGRFHHQISVIREDNDRIFLGWQSPGFDKFSVKNVFASKTMPGKKFAFTSSTHGSVRSMVPIGSYEKVMPLDMLATLLLRSLLAKDTDRAQELGCLELDEEDVALCSFVCTSKINYGPVLREALANIEKDG